MMKASSAQAIDEDKYVRLNNGTNNIRQAPVPQIVLVGEDLTFKLGKVFLLTLAEFTLAQSKKELFWV